MSIQFTCHKYPPDILTKKLLTIRVFIHFDDEVAGSKRINKHIVISMRNEEKSIHEHLRLFSMCIDLSLCSR
jgi:hypothetical protein